jgi:suppressor for copper-sensitivity B
MGFLMLGTVVWLLRPLVAQIGGEGLLWTLVFLLFVSAAAWCYGRVDYGSSMTRRTTCYGGAVLLVVVGWWFSFIAMKPDPGEIAWVPYSRQQALDLAHQGNTIFVDYTADWCLNCKANERLVIDTPQVRKALQRLGVVPMKADFTKFDPEIAEDLKRFKRSGVPMYVILPAGRPDEPILLNEILTQGAIIEGLEKAGPSSVSNRLSVAATGR